ncbi:Arc family DNA-binding protein [Limosilactobacillus reuteri]|uniref:Arc family DNA-binding protein n=1 Tax=Limosilactobacillus reuteri TaxID=1598 RepID=UPI001CDBE810|nr:Arc family DNA-binding protein [Limosilactobacillus reuteri]
MYTLPSRKPFFSLRIPVELMDKLKYIADYNGRSANKEIEQLIIKHVNNFEKENGPININKD